jgi:hypothetical protein
MPHCPPATKRRVLVTGASGNVGQEVIPALADRYDLVLTDRVPFPKVCTFPFIQADITEIAFLSEYETVGYYVKSLRTYFNYFSRKQIGIYLYDDLCSNPIAMMQDIYQFLGVDSSFVPAVSQKYHYTIVPKSRQVSQIVRQDSLLKRIVKKLIPKQLRRKILQLNQSRPHLHPAVHKQLSAEYADEIDELQELIGRDLSTWLVPTADLLPIFDNTEVE